MEKLANKQRNISFDFLKALAIFLVVLGHCEQYLTKEGTSSHLYLFVYFFHMPLFVFISGYFYHNSLKKYDVKALIYNKIKTILLPSISCTILLTFISGNILSFVDISYVFASFWFLKSLFLMMVCSIIIKWNLYIGSVIVYFLFSLMSFIIGASLILFFLLGIFYHKYEVTILDNQRFIISSFFFLLAFCAALYVNFAWGVFYVLIRVFLVLLIVLAARLLCDNLVNKRLFLKSICKPGLYTKEIYLIQTFVLESFLGNFYPYKEYTLFYITIPLAFLLTWGFTILSRELRKIPYISNYILGYWK